MHVYVLITMVLIHCGLGGATVYVYQLHTVIDHAITIN